MDVYSQKHERTDVTAVITVYCATYNFEWMQWSHIGLFYPPGFRVRVPPYLQDTGYTLEEGLWVHKPSERQKHLYMWVKTIK